MKRLYYSIVAIIVWFSLLFNLELVLGRFQTAPFLHLLLPVCSVLVISILRRRKVPAGWIFAVVLVAYTILKYQLDFTWSEIDISNIIDEIALVTVTLILSIIIGQKLEEIRATLSNLVIGELDKEVEPFEHGQSLLYREVRRARRHHHSLALLAISAPKVPLNMSIERSPNTPFPTHVVADLQRELSNKYLHTLVGGLLLDELDACAIVTQSDNHFVVLLPETSNEELQTSLQLLQSAAEDKLGFGLQIGTATFPDQELTLEALLEHAELALLTTSSAVIPPVYSNGTQENPLERVPMDSNNVQSV